VDRAGRPPTSSSLAEEKRVGSLLLSTAARDPRFDCSLPLAADRAGKPALFRYLSALHSFDI
jgi:hypothetical protein